MTPLQDRMVNTLKEPFCYVDESPGHTFFGPCPDGPAAGARAFRQAIDAVMEGIKVSDYAEEHEELKTALTKWGYW